jgi:hypothetical protein
MGKDDDQLQAWCALWARLQQEKEGSTDGNRRRDRLEVAFVVAAAGMIRRHQERAANDMDAAALIWALAACWLYAITCANWGHSRGLRAANAATVELVAFPRIPWDSREFPPRANTVTWAQAGHGVRRRPPCRGQR